MIRRLLFVVLFFPVVVFWTLGSPFIWAVTGKNPVLLLDKYFTWGIGE